MLSDYSIDISLDSETSKKLSECMEEVADKMCLTVNIKPVVYEEYGFLVELEDSWFLASSSEDIVDIGVECYGFIVWLYGSRCAIADDETIEMLKAEK